ncbi:MAG: hypothetical protein OEY22_11540 [Candidatus Bathyarchaeota archaeon]|nr:hypothetical protein [Candidatus Bathyarchaeota archaeon]MDH5788021.1 hypothetical protein [Candidatus Bathyarchaeota archaeon]
MKTKYGILLVFLLLQILWLHAVQVAEAQATAQGLYAGGTNPGIVYRYAGDTTWEVISPVLGWSVTSIVMYGEDWYVGAITDKTSFNSVGKVWKYDGRTWTDVGTLDNQVCFLIVYKGDLYAGTGINAARLYKFNVETTSWTKVLEVPMWPQGWYGFRSAYVWNDWLYLGEWAFDQIARWDGTTFEIFFSIIPAGSCIYSFEEYGGYLYAGAYKGTIYRINNVPAAAQIWQVPNRGFAWALKSFGNCLYIGADANGTSAAPLCRYDGTSFTQVWSYSRTTMNPHEGILSTATDANYLYLGVGGQAVGYPDRMTGDGTGLVYKYDGINPPELISSPPLGTGAQTLYYGPVPVPSPQEAIQDLIDDVQSLNLQQGIVNSLDAKLTNALSALNALNAGQRNDAVNKLNAFINEVEAQRGTKLTNEQADYLITAVQDVIALTQQT